jgi:alanine racemase
MTETYPTWIEINLPAITSNCARIIRETGTRLMAIVKADAYGHGAVEVSCAAVEGGASWLGVARFGEARVLRQNGIRVPILVLGMVTPDEVDEALASDVTLTLHNLETLQLFSARASVARKPVMVHLKVDTGMGRLGIFAEEAVRFARQAQAAGGIHMDGMYSHLSVAEEQHPLNELQHQRFDLAVHAMEDSDLRPPWVHLANSAGAFYQPQSRYDMVRVGNVVLGLRIRVDQPLPDGYQPALTWKAQLASSRLLPGGWSVGYGAAYVTSHEEIIGVVPVGYGDGLRRFPGNHVLIGGIKHPVVGSLCLDQLMVRLPHHFPMGEEVVIVGQQGNSALWVHDLAALYQISQVDFTSLVHRRVPRIYIRNS